MNLPFLYLLIACGKKESDSATLPPQDTAEEDNSYEPSFELGPPMRATKHLMKPQKLNIQHAGIWNLSPGPYNSMYGELNIQELIDGYTVVPTATSLLAVDWICQKDLCETCDFGFSIDFFVLEPNHLKKEKKNS